MNGNRRAIRRRVGISKAATARLAGVSTGLVTLFEADPDAVVDGGKRAALTRLYLGFDDLAKTATAA